MAAGPLKDPPVLEAVIEGLMARPCRQLHPKISLRITAIVGALDLVGVPHIVIVSLDAFLRQEVACEGVQEDLGLPPKQDFP